MERHTFDGTWMLLGAALLVAILAAAGYAIVLEPGSMNPTPHLPNADSAPVFTFAAVGDFDAPADADMVGLAKRLATANVDFLLALGDLGYVSDEQAWCDSIKGAFNNTIIVAGNHDTTESGPGDINNAINYCNFNLGVPLTPGPTYGYGKSYYFDYPAANPLVRFILITAGLTGSQTSGQNYGSGGAEYNWVVNAVNSARSSNISWIVVGLHKNCLTVGSKTSCTMGQEMFDKLVDLKVDLILQAHDHVYERSKQLALGPACTTVPSAGNFDADCVVADGASGVYTKGVGSIEVVQGAGGRDTYTVKIDGSDREMGYFVEVMGSNANTQGKLNGHGAVKYAVSQDRIVVETDFCPLGSTDSTGQCTSQKANTFYDTFTIQVAAPPSPGPTAAFTYAPTYARVGQTVSLDASSSTDSDPTETLESRWDWTNDGIWDTNWSATMTASHAYVSAGIVTVRLEVRDSVGLTDNATNTVVVDGAAPTTASGLSGTAGSGGWYTSAVSVSLSATDDLSGVEQTRYRLDGGSWTTYGSAFQISTDGSHTVDFNSTDRAGNWEPLKSTSVKVDRTAPTSSHALSGTLVNGTYYLAPVTVTLSASDATSGVASTRYRLDGGTWEPYSSAISVSVNGTHVLEYDSTDIAGNSESTKQAVFAIGVPPSGPMSFLSVEGTPGSGGWYISGVTLTLSAIDSSGTGVTVHYSLDGAAWRTYTTSISLSDGEHILKYYATDNLGNTEPTHSATFKIDTVPPTTIAIPAGALGADGWYVSAVGVTLNATDEGSGMALLEYRIDGGVWQEYGPSTEIELADGRHTLEARGTDIAGLQEAAAVFSFNVDTEGPEFSIASPQGYVWSNEVQIIWSASDRISGVSGYEISVDGGDFIPATGATATYNLADGVHFVAIRAIDRAGNARMVALDIRVDTNPLSPTGPMSGVPLYLLLGALLATGVGVLFRIRRRRKRRAGRRGD